MTDSLRMTEPSPDASTRREDEALDRLMSVATAIDEEWTRGASQVAELERQAERVRDEVRERTAHMEDEQAAVLVELAQTHSPEQLAALLNVSLEGAWHLVGEAERRVAQVPEQRTTEN